MDQTRRKLVLASASVPATLVLQACGGGSEVATSSAGAPQATAMAAKPASGGYIDIASIVGKSIDAVFRSGGTSDYLRYFVPVASNLRTQAVLHSSSNTAFVSMTEVLTTKTNPVVTHHRCLSLELAGFPAVGANKQYNGNYKGSLIVNTTTADGSARHYDYDLKTGGIKVTHVSEGVMKLEFVGVGLDYVDGAPTTSQTFSTSPATTLSLMSGSNLAANPFLLKTTASTAVTVSYMLETGGWV